MEKPPYVFQDITHFSVGAVETVGPKFKEIKTLTLEIGSKIPPGKYPLALIKPFPPLGRPGKKLDQLTSLDAQDIESVRAFPKPDDKPWARIEIWGRTTLIVNCDRIEGVPTWEEGRA